MGQDRESLKIVVVGHVDHGKSTIIGRLLYDTKSINEGKIEKVKAICKEKGKPFEYAYLLDAFEEEQKQGITIDTTQIYFSTQKRDYIIIDAPGHKEFLKNMVSGAANAEAALLIIDAQEGVKEQSKRHGYILSLIGIRKVFVIVNKMDLIDYSEEKFNQIKQQMNEFLNKLHVYPLKYIPVSGFYGDNIAKKSDKMPWFKGDPIITAIDQIEKEKGLIEKPLRFPIQDIYKFDNRRIIAGRIESGSLSVGDKILISPDNKITKVKSIEFWQDKDKKDTIFAGMSVGITLEDEFFNKRGEVITHIDNKPSISDVFKANIFWMGKKPLIEGNKYKLKLVTQEVECEILKINKVINTTTLDVDENIKLVNINDVAEVTIKTKVKIWFDEFVNNQNTGRFVLVDDYDISGGGIVLGLDYGFQNACKLVSEEHEIVVNCFDEYYYQLNVNIVQKVNSKPEIFKIGDVVPINGRTYLYPENFDIFDLEQKVVAKIRNSILIDIESIKGYNYSMVPLINTRGFYIKVKTDIDFQKFLDELSLYDGKFIDEYFANKWFDFMKFREIKYKDSDDNYELEYML
ncbi:sulfate adenylyltransferase subunit 1 [Caldicellulosiruptoraceae bacterium PP1]